jgi:hypothetical protein
MIPEKGTRSLGGPSAELSSASSDLGQPLVEACELCGVHMIAGNTRDRPLKTAFSHDFISSAIIEPPLLLHL